jgi:fluoroquinolone resistance protein
MLKTVIIQFYFLPNIIRLDITNCMNIVNNDNFNPKQTEYEQVEFDSCNFQDIDFSDFVFDGCEFKNCNLSNVIIKNTRFMDCKFGNCKMIGVNWSVIKEGLTFDNVYNDSCLDFCNFAQLNLVNLEATNCSFVEAFFDESNLTNSVLNNCDFNGAIFTRANFTKADLRNSRNYFIDVINCKISKAKFSLPEAQSLLKSLDIIIDE